MGRQELALLAEVCGFSGNEKRLKHYRACWFNMDTEAYHSIGIGSTVASNWLQFQFPYPRERAGIDGEWSLHLIWHGIPLMVLCMSRLMAMVIVFMAVPWVLETLESLSAVGP